MTACVIETAGRDGRTVGRALPGPERAGWAPESESGAGAGAGAAGRFQAPAPGGLTIAADGSYAARLSASPGGGGCPERWTLDGPEPYAVPLPGPRPEHPGSTVLPLADGRVLIARRAAGHHLLALLYPTGPDTGELFLGAVESERLTLLPPAPCGRRAYALVHGEQSTAVWLVADCTGGAERPYPQQVAQVPGWCAGGAWLDREGRLLAVDRTDLDGSGRTKTVVVDLARDGAVSPLLEISEDSDDRLLSADPDSGLLLVRSNAPGEHRLGWGVLGSHRPIRFPEALHPEGALLTPFAVQPGQMLLPEDCAVALCGQTVRGGSASGSGGTSGSGDEEAAAETYEQPARPVLGLPWLAVWRPARRELVRFPAPRGWFTGRGVWTRGGELRLPYATAQAPCGLARLRLPSARQGAGDHPGGGERPEGAATTEGATTPPPGSASAAEEHNSPAGGTSAPDGTACDVHDPASGPASEPASAPDRVPGPGAEPDPTPGAETAEAVRAHEQPKPVPLQQAPLAPFSSAERWDQTPTTCTRTV